MDLIFGIVRDFGEHVRSGISLAIAAGGCRRGVNMSAMYSLILSGLT